MGGNRGQGAMGERGTSGKGGKWGKGGNGGARGASGQGYTSIYFYIHLYTLIRAAVWRTPINQTSKQFMIQIIAPRIAPGAR